MTFTVIQKWVSRWLFSTNHKDIGTLYLILGMFLFLIGTCLPIFIRMEVTLILITAFLNLLELIEYFSCLHEENYCFQDNSYLYINIFFIYKQKKKLNFLQHMKKFSFLSKLINLASNLKTKGIPPSENIIPSSAESTIVQRGRGTYNSSKYRKFGAKSGIQENVRLKHQKIQSSNVNNLEFPALIVNTIGVLVAVSGVSLVIDDHRVANGNDSWFFTKKNAADIAIGNKGTFAGKGTDEVNKMLEDDKKTSLVEKKPVSGENLPKLDIIKKK